MRILVAVLVAFVFGCGNSGSGGSRQKVKTKQDLVTEYGPKLEARLEKLVAAHVAGKAAASELGAPGDSKLALDFLSGAATDKPNAIAVQSEDLENAKAAAPKEEEDARAGQLAREISEAAGMPKKREPRLLFQQDHQNHVFAAKSVLGYETGDTEGTEQQLKQLLDATYVLVVYTKQHRMPIVGSDDFTVGMANVVAVLVDIETGKPMGGFEASATSSEKIGVSIRTTDGTVIEGDKKVRRDLYKQISKAIADGITTRWPGAKAPPSWTSGW